MSDKQIVERNGVSMDSHSSGNRPASEVEAVKKEVLNRYSDAKVQPWSEELGHEPDDLFCVFATANGAWRPIGYRKKTEGGAWISAASKLPAPLTEDAPKGIDWANDEAVVRAAVENVYIGDHTGWVWVDGNIRYVLGETWSEARKRQDVVAFERDHNPAFRVPASPAGERGGEFDKWWNPIKETLYFLQDVEVERATLSARQGWDARAALAAKPSPEGIPERPKHLVLANHGSGSNAFFGYSEAVKYFDALESLLSAKGAESARLTAELKIETELSDKRAGLWLKEYERAEAAEAELSALKLSIARKDLDINRLLECMKGIRASLGIAPHEVMDVMDATCVTAEVEHGMRAYSARVRDEALREALEAVRHHTDPTDASWGRLNSLHRSILSLIPTSPEQTEEGQ